MQRNSAWSAHCKDHQIEKAEEIGDQDIPVRGPGFHNVRGVDRSCEASTDGSHRFCLSLISLTG